MKKALTLADIVGPWEEPAFESGLIARCRAAWTKPLAELSREELATLLRQKIAVAQLIPVAKRKIADADDGSEMYRGELAAAIEHAEEA